MICKILKKHAILFLFAASVFMLTTTDSAHAGTTIVTKGSVGNKKVTANWQINNYTVTCIDRIENTSTELGRGTKSLQYNSTVSGATWGTDATLSKYRIGYIYVSSSANTVVPANNNLVVYRYFRLVKPSFTQPSNATVNYGAQTTYTAYVSNATATRWQKAPAKTDGTAGAWTDISGTNKTWTFNSQNNKLTYTTPAGDAYNQRTYYRVVADGDGGTTYSNAVTLNVNAPSVSDILPASKSVNMFAQKDYYSAAVTSNSKAYWQIYNPSTNTWSNIAANDDYKISGTNTTLNPTLTVVANRYSMNGNKYRLVADGYKRYSDNGIQQASKEFTLGINKLHNVVTYDLSDIITIEGSSNTQYVIGATFANSRADNPADTRYPGTPAYTWQYCLPATVSGSDHQWHDIFDASGNSVEFYTVNEGGTNKLLLTRPSGVEYRDFEITKFERLRNVPMKTTDYNGISINHTESSIITIKNARSVSCDGLMIRVILRSFNDGIVEATSSVSTLSVIAEDYIDFNSYLFSNSQNIGTVLDPMKPGQFVNMVKYNNNTTRYYTDRLLRFYNYEDAPQYGAYEDEIEDSIKIKIAELNGDASQTADQKETSAWLSSHNLLKNSDIQIDGMTFEYIYAPGNGKYYIASRWKNESGGYEYYYSKFTYGMLGMNNEKDATETGGTLTSFNYTVKKGKNKVFVIIPSLKDITKTVVSEVQFNGEDFEGPAIQPIKKYWGSIAEENVFTSNVIKASATVWLATEAEDNCTSQDKIVYQWLKDGVVYGSPITGEGGLSIRLDGPEECNAEYRLQATDEEGNTTVTEPVTLDIWDTQAPTATVTVTPGVQTPSREKVVKIVARDLHPADKPIAFTQSATVPAADSDEWKTDNVYTVKRNGIYRIFVRDIVGNIYEWTDENGNNTIEITNLDNVAPTITGIQANAQKNDEGKNRTFNAEDGTTKAYVKVTVTASDRDDIGTDTSGALLYRIGQDHNGNGKLDDDLGEVLSGWQRNGTFSGLENDGIYMVEVKDGALPEANITRITTEDVDNLILSGEYAKMLDPEYILDPTGVVDDSLDGPGNIELLKDVFGIKVYAVPDAYTTKDVNIYIEVTKNIDKLAKEPYSFTNGTSYQRQNRYTADSNGEFRLAIKDIYENVYRLGVLTVDYIDRDNPDFNLTVNDKRNTAEMTATDLSSKMGKITVSTYNGSEWTSEKTIASATAEETLSFSYSIPALGEYIFTAYDNVGNKTEYEQISITSAQTDNPYLKFEDDGLTPSLSCLDDYILTDYTGWTKGNLTLTLALPDTTGLASAPYQWQKVNRDANGNITNIPLEGEFTNNNTHVVNENGEYIVYAKDRYGNIFGGKITISNIDKVAPESGWDDEGAFARISDDGHNSRIELKAKDDLSGIDKFTVDVGGGEQTIFDVPNGRLEAEYTYHLPASRKDYTFRAYDNAGSYIEWTITASEIGDITTDNEYLSREHIEANIRKTPASWTNGNVVLDPALPSTEQLASEPYSWEGGSWAPASNKAFTVYENGLYNLRVKDMYGNIIEATVEVGNIDKTAPAISEPRFNATKNKIAFTLSDTQSGVSRFSVAYMHENGALGEFNALREFSSAEVNETEYIYTVPRKGTYVFMLTDKAGNTTMGPDGLGSCAVVTVNDAMTDNPCLIGDPDNPKDPSTALSEYIKQDGGNEWTNEDVTLILDLPDTSGLADEPYLWREIDVEREPVYETDENGNIKHDGSGNPIQAKDENGNPAYGDPVLDENGKPVIKTDSEGNPIYLPIPGYGDGTGENPTGNKSTDVSRNGLYDVTAYDAYGNEYHGQAIVSNIDRVKPGLKALPNERKNTITLTGTDYESKMARITVKGMQYSEETTIKSAEDHTHSTLMASFKVPSNGTFEFRAYDNAGNVSNTAVIEITGAQTDNPYLVDPASGNTAKDISKYIKASESGWTNKDIVLTAAIPDTQGFADKPYSWNGGTFTESNTCTATGNGTYTLVVKDVYGNIYTGAITLGKIDKTGPALRATEDDGTLLISAGDSASGLDYVTIERLDASGKPVDTQRQAFQKNSNGAGPYTASVVYKVAESGRYRITATDVAGNVSSPRILDAIASTGGADKSDYAAENFTGAGIAQRIEYDPYTWTNQDVTITLKLSSSDMAALKEGGFAKYTIEADGAIITYPEGDAYTSDTKYKIPRNSSLYVTLLDKEGRRHKSNNIDISNIDKEDPRIDAVSYKKFVDYYDYMSTEPSMKRAEVVMYKADAEDVMSGVHYMYVDGNILAAYTNPLQRQASITFMPVLAGTHIAKVSDHAGNSNTTAAPLNNDQSRYILSQEGLDSSVYYEEINLKDKKVTLWTDLDLKDENGLPLLSIEWVDENGEVVAEGARCTVTDNMNVRMRVTYDDGRHTHTAESSERIIDCIDKIKPLLEAKKSTADPTVIMIQAADAESGLSEIVIACPDGTARRVIGYKDCIKEDSVAYKCHADGQYIVTVYDRAGNSVSSEPIAIEAASESYGINEGNYNEVLSRSVYLVPGSWTNGNVTVKIDLTNKKGLAAEPYSYDGGETWTAETAKTFDSNQIVQVAIRDVNGNEYHKPIEINQIDRTVPSIDVSQENTQTYAKVSITARDSESGVDSVYISGGEYATETLLSTHGGKQYVAANINIAANGSYLLRVTDQAGNQETRAFTISGLAKNLEAEQKTETLIKTQTITETKTETVKETVPVTQIKTETETVEVPVERIVEVKGETRTVYLDPETIIEEKEVQDPALLSRLEEAQAALLSRTEALSKANKKITELERQQAENSRRPAIYTSDLAESAYSGGGGLTMNRNTNSPLGRYIADLRNFYESLFGRDGGNIMMILTALFLLLLLILICAYLLTQLLKGGEKDRRKAKAKAGSNRRA